MNVIRTKHSASQPTVPIDATYALNYSIQEAQTQYASAKYGIDSQLPVKCPRSDVPCTESSGQEPLGHVPPSNQTPPPVRHLVLSKIAVLVT